MSKIQKLFIVGGLGAVCLLSFVMKEFFNPSNSQIQFSSGEQSQSSKLRLNKCKKGIQEVVDNKRTEYRCRVSTKKTQAEASYTMQFLIIISRKDNGEIAIEVSGNLRNPTQHATEADFCEEGCKLGHSSQKASNSMEVIQETAPLISELENQARLTVELAKNSYDQKQERQAQIDQCLGKWHDHKKKIFETFNIDKQLNCKFNKWRSITDPRERELFYQTAFKQDLWSLAISDAKDKDALKAGLLDTITDPYYSASTKSSASLLAMYLDWRERYNLLADIEQKTQFVNQIHTEAYSFASQLDPRYVQDDLTLLNEGMEQNFKEALSRIRSVPLPSASGGTNPSLPTVDYNLKQKIREIR